MAGKTVLSLVMSSLAALTAVGATESVLVTKVMDDKAIVTRSNGDSYLIEKGVGCLSLWRYEGKSVVIVSPGLFLGVGSTLLIPELGQECRVWDSEPLSGGIPLPQGASPLGNMDQPNTAAPAVGAMEGIMAVQRGLRMVGYDPGTIDGVVGPATSAALERYRVSKGYPLTEEGLAKTLIALAVDVAVSKPGDDGALQLSIKLLELASLAAGIERTVPAQGVAPSKAPCEEGHWVQSVSSSGEIVALENGSVWEIDLVDRIHTMLWLPVERISICGGRLLNTNKGKTVRASRIR